MYACGSRSRDKRFCAFRVTVDFVEQCSFCRRVWGPGDTNDFRMLFRRILFRSMLKSTHAVSQYGCTHGPCLPWEGDGGEGFAAERQCTQRRAVNCFITGTDSSLEPFLRSCHGHSFLQGTVSMPSAIGLDRVALMKKIVVRFCLAQSNLSRHTGLHSYNQEEQDDLSEQVRNLEARLTARDTDVSNLKPQQGRRDTSMSRHWSIWRYGDCEASYGVPGELLSWIF